MGLHLSTAPKSLKLTMYHLPSDLGLQCRRLRFDPWVRKIPWRREWLPSPVFLPGEFHGQRSLAGYSQWGCKKADTTERLTLSTSTWKPSIAFSFQDPILLCTLRQITLRSWHLVPSLHGKKMGKQWKQWLTLFFWAPKSLQMVIAAK